MPILTIPGEGTQMLLAEAGITALLGYAVVFFGLILLMIVVILIGKSFAAASTKKVPDAQTAAIVDTATPASQAPTAPGTAGELKLHDVDPKTAAMLMAIVADKLGKPLNELRFISVKEVK